MNRSNRKSNRFDPQGHRRRSIRLKGYDYTTPGGYFITVCTYQREPLFGEIVDGQMVTNELGAIVQHAWDDLPNHYPYLVLDQFCIMPNHIHGILILTDSPSDSMHAHNNEYTNHRRGISNVNPTDSRRGGSDLFPPDSRRGGSETRPFTEPRPLNDLPSQPKRHGLPEIVRAFKSFSSCRINQMMESQGNPTWQ